MLPSLGRGGVRLLALNGLLAGLALIALAGCSTMEPTPSATPTLAPIDEDQLAQSMVRFASGQQTIAEIPFTDEVSLGLADRLLARRSAEELVDVRAWLVDAGPEGFRERSGPFSALELLASAGETVVSIGPHGSCNTPDPPIPAPAGLAGLRIVSIQPVPGAVAACMQWWSVDLYVTPAGEISAVTLDMGAP